MAKLTDQEKKMKGTFRKVRALKPRGLKVIRAEIETVQQCITDMQYNLTEAGKAVRELGLMIETTITDNHGTAHVKKVVNPAINIQQKALSALKTLKRHMTLLQEEESLAGKKETEEQEADEWAEFQ